MYTITDLYDLEHTLAKEYLSQFTYPWEALKGIKDMIIALGAKLDPEEYEEREPQVWVHKTAKVFPTAYLGAPCIIGANTEPMKYRKSVISASGRKIAPTVPMTVTATAASLPFTFAESDSPETPAEYASRKVVVTVENTMIKSPAMPRPAFTMICAISDSPVKMAAPMPIMYIQQLTKPYVIALTAVALTGFFASLV